MKESPSLTAPSYHEGALLTMSGRDPGDEIRPQDAERPQAGSLRLVHADEFAYLLQLPSQHKPVVAESSQPMRPMYAMEVKGLDVMTQDPVEQPARA